jgi:hypothetical protein
MRIIFSTVFITMITFCRVADAAERFVVIADAEVPDLKKTVQNAGVFAEKIMPGSQMMMVGGLIALNFDKRFASFDMNSALRFLVYGDTSDKPVLLPQVCGVADCKKQQRSPENIEIGGKEYFVGHIGDKIVISSSKQLISALNPADQPAVKDNSDLTVDFSPSVYIRKCPGNVASVKTELEKRVPGKFRKNAAAVIAAAEQILKQCRTINTKVEVCSSEIKFVVSVKPLDGTAFSDVLSGRKDGRMSLADLSAIGRKVSGNKVFDVVQAAKLALFITFFKFFSDKNKLPSINLSDVRILQKDSSVVLSGIISQHTVYELLMSLGVIQNNLHSDSL